MESEDYVRLIVSDLHLGSAHSKEKELLELLSTIEYDELVLAGDIIEFLRKPEFTKDSIELLKSIVESEKKIIYLRYYKGLSQTEIATILDLSQMHISRLLTKSIAKLKKNFPR